MSMSIRARATRCSQIECSISFLPNATRDCSRFTIAFSASSAAPIVRMQWWIRPGPSRPCAISKPRPSPSSMVEAGTRTSFERDLHMAVRRVVIAVDGERALDRDARRVERHQHHRLLPVLVGRAVGLAHQDRDLAARIAGARRPPFAAVDHIIVAVAGDVAFDIGRVGRGDRRLGHQEGRADLAVHQRPQPFLLLLARAVAVEHLHIAGVGRRAVEHLGRPQDPAHLLGAERIFEVGELGALELEALVDMRERAARRHEQVPQPLRAGAGFSSSITGSGCQRSPSASCALIVPDCAAGSESR